MDFLSQAISHFIEIPFVLSIFWIIILLFHAGESFLTVLVIKTRLQITKTNSGNLKQQGSLQYDYRWDQEKLSLRESRHPGISGQDQGVEPDLRVEPPS